MLFTSIIIGFLNIVEWLVSLFPSVPSFIDFNSPIFNQFTDILFDNLGLLDVFAPINLISVCIAGMISLVIVKYAIDIIMWILKKIPLASME